MLDQLLISINAIDYLSYQTRFLSKKLANVSKFLIHTFYDPTNLIKIPYLLVPFKAALK